MSGGHLCKAETLTEPKGENVPYNTVVPLLYFFGSLKKHGINYGQSEYNFVKQSSRRSPLWTLNSTERLFLLTR